MLWKDTPTLLPDSDVWLGSGFGAKGWKVEKENDCLACLLRLSSFSDEVKASLEISLLFAGSKKSLSSPKILDRQHTETTNCKMIFVV